MNTWASQHNRLTNISATCKGSRQFSDIIIKNNFRSYSLMILSQGSFCFLTHFLNLSPSRALGSAWWVCRVASSLYWWSFFPRECFKWVQMLKLPSLHTGSLYVVVVFTLVDLNLKQHKQTHLHMFPCSCYAILSQMVIPPSRRFQLIF